MQDSQIHNSSRRFGRAKALVAIATAGLALAAAGPAAAEDNAPQPQQKGCTIILQKPDGSPGQGVVYPHGFSFSVTDVKTGKTHTYTCNNGQWVETVSAIGRAVNSIGPVGGVVMQVKAYDPRTGITRRYTYKRNKGKWELLRVPRRHRTR